MVIWERLDEASFTADADVSGITYRLTAEQTRDGSVWEWLSWPVNFPNLARGGDEANVVAALHAAEAAANAGGDASILPAILVGRA